MKVWQFFAAEHSARLHVIGRFANAGQASLAHRLMTQLEEVAGDFEHPIDLDALRLIVEEHQFHYVSSTELEEFNTDHSVLPVEGNQFEVYTNDPIVGLFAKVMLQYGAQIEIRSDHANDRRGIY